MNFKSWLNIFDECNLVDYDASNFYIVRWSVHNDCIVIKNGVSIVDDPAPIFEKYNIFDAKNIGVDYESFREEVERSFEHIRDLIVEQYNLSYIRKIILRRDLPHSYLESYLKKWKCELLVEGDGFLMVKDNLGDVYKIGAFFDERKWDDYEPYFSKMEILEKIVS